MFFRENYSKISNDELEVKNNFSPFFYGQNILFDHKSYKLKKINTSESRYYYRFSKWIGFISVKYEFLNPKIAKLIAKINHHYWWLVHNCIAHPFLAFYFHQNKLAIKFELPTKAVYFHDWTSEKLNLEESMSFSVPDPDSIKWWIIHNLICHPLIGLFPCKIAFKWHDSSAKLMKDPSWI